MDKTFVDEKGDSQWDFFDLFGRSFFFLIFIYDLQGEFHIRISIPGFVLY